MPGNQTVSITVEAEAGPVLRTALDVLDLSAELIDLIPDWHEAQKRELASRCGALQQTANERLKLTTRERKR